MWMLVICAILPAQASATPAGGTTDTLRISLITCEPGPDVYQVYGHTAIRVQNFGNEPFDEVFNYGTFYFDDGFMSRFIKGETDYMLGVSSYNYFMSDYIERRSSVIEQELNLTPYQKADLYHMLCENAKPENCEYRYNFLYDNCATRPRDMVVALLRAYGEEVTFKPAAQLPSVRDVIKQYSANYSWALLGMDLALGCEIDRKGDYNTLMFSPIILRDAFNKAVISNEDGTTRPLVVRENVLYNSGVIPVMPPTPWYKTPLFFATILLIITTFVTWCDKMRRQISRWFDTIFNLSFFAMSLIIYFLILFSAHPATTVNINALIFTPITIIPAILSYFDRTQTVVRWYHCINMLLILVAILLGVLGVQHLHIVVYLLAFMSLMRSYNYMSIITPRSHKRSYKRSRRR